MQELIGDAAGKLHTGRSRNDQVSFSVIGQCVLCKCSAVLISVMIHEGIQWFIGMYEGGVHLHSFIILTGCHRHEALVTGCDRYCEGPCLTAYNYHGGEGL